MKVIESSGKICCDVPGCKGIAAIYLQKEQKSHEYDSVKLCSKCAYEIFGALKKIYAKKETARERSTI